MTLTHRQAEILAFISSRDRTPTIREIGQHFGIRSPNGVLCHLDSLERKGAIKRDPFHARNITVLNDPVLELRKAMRRGSLQGVRLEFNGKVYRIREEA